MFPTRTGTDWSPGLRNRTEAAQTSLRGVGITRRSIWLRPKWLLWRQARRARRPFCRVPKRGVRQVVCDLTDQGQPYRMNAYTLPDRRKAPCKGTWPH
jgi:hypothetical protein